MAFSVVIADDNLALCSALEQILSTAGYEVLGSAHDGLSVLDLVRAKEPDILILDIILPLLDGIGVLQQLMNDKKKPVIFVLSAVNSDFITSLLLKEGASMVFAKPMDLNLLTARIEMIMKALSPEKYRQAMALHQADVISETLQVLSIPKHQLGYHYIVAGLKQLLEGGAMPMMNLYQSIAHEQHTTSANVERCIRHSIESAWNTCRPSDMERYFGYTIDPSRGKPTNNEFMAMVTDHLKRIMQR